MEDDKATLEPGAKGIIANGSHEARVFEVMPCFRFPTS